MKRKLLNALEIAWALFMIFLLSFILGFVIWWSYTVLIGGY